jgi:biotin carboxyl carrier protein
VTIEGEAVELELVECGEEGTVWRFRDGERIRARISRRVEPPSVELFDDAGVRLARVEVSRPAALPRKAHTAEEGVVAVTAPLSGTVAAVQVAVGDAVAVGQLLLVLEAMKMEHRIIALEAGVVREVLVGAGDVVRDGDVLVEVE